MLPKSAWPVFLQMRQRKYDPSHPLLLIPCFEHEQALLALLPRINQDKWTTLVIDDGNANRLASLKESFPTLAILHQERNLGKGAALQAGMQVAHKLGFQAVISMDADGQHFAEDLESFCQVHQQEPKALLIGQRDFRSPHIPVSSRIGRFASNLGLYLQTGQWIADTQSGFRLYPLLPSILEKSQGKRFDFETETIAQHLWSGNSVLSLPIRVYYPAVAQERVSHYRPWLDSLHLIFTHLILALSSLAWRLGLKNRQKPREIPGSKLAKQCLRLLPPRLAYSLMRLPSLYLFLRFASLRLALDDYYQLLYPSWNLWQRRRASFRNCLYFGASLIDRLLLRERDLIAKDRDAELTQLAQHYLPAQSILLGAHYGDWLLLARRFYRFLPQPLVLVMNPWQNPEFFEEIAASFEGKLVLLDATMDSLSFLLQAKDWLEAGATLAFLADRLPDYASPQRMQADFLGRDREWQRLPFALASKLSVATFFFAATKEELRADAPYSLCLEKLQEAGTKKSEAALLQAYIHCLSTQVRLAPQHWFNFERLT